MASAPCFKNDRMASNQIRSVLDHSPMAGCDQVLQWGQYRHRAQWWIIEVSPIVCKWSCTTPSTQKDENTQVLTNGKLKNKFDNRHQNEWCRRKWIKFDSQGQLRKDVGIQAENEVMDAQHDLWHENQVGEWMWMGRGLESVAVSDPRMTANQWEKLTLTSQWRWDSGPRNDTWLKSSWCG